jgi:hypothetical protein
VSDYVTINETQQDVTTGDIGGLKRKHSWPILWFYPGIYLKDLRKTT